MYNILLHYTKLVLISMLVLLALSNCQATLDTRTVIIQEAADPRPYTMTDPIFVPFIIEFEQEANMLIGDIPVYVKPLKGPIAAQCSRWLSEGRVYKAIEVDFDWFLYVKKTALAIRNMLEHELGHCLLNRLHDETLLPNGKPKSVMYPTLQYSDPYYEENHQYYLDELLGRD